MICLRSAQALALTQAESHPKIRGLSAAYGESRASWLPSVVVSSLASGASLAGCSFEQHSLLLSRDKNISPSTTLPDDQEIYTQKT